MFARIVGLFIALSSAADAACPAPSPTWSAEPDFIAPTHGPVVETFGLRRDPILGYTKLHTGIDYRGDIGDHVVAAASGTVAEAARRGDYGNFVLLDHGNGLTTAYAHLSTIAVSIGACVAAGQLIGKEGSTGLSVGPHLHFEVRRDGVAIDPVPFIKASSR